MKTNKEAIILTERAADYGRHRAVLSEWGYEENDIQRVLKEQGVDKTHDEGSARGDRPGASAGYVT